MAEAALTAARSIIGGAISKAATAAAEEMSLLMGVQNEIWFMRDELKAMQAFLIVADATHKKPLLKVCADQVRSLSYDIEDCLDEFMVHIGNRSLSLQLMKLKDRHRIAVQIRNLKSRLEEVSSRNTRYNLIQMEDTKLDEAHFCMEDVRKHSAINIAEAELVGTSTFKKDIFKMIDAYKIDGYPQVICVFGMGGTGKTTLVRMIYEKQCSIEKKFQYRAWITLSQSFSRIDVIKDMIRQLFGRDEDGTIQYLGEYLKKNLKGRRYFIVVDDLWAIDGWIWIRDICFPRSNNTKSLIVITTRDGSVGRACITRTNSKPSMLELQPLGKKHSIKLLLKKMQKSKQDRQNHDNLKDLVTKLEKKCGGLPLAIVTIGAMFASKHELEWGKLYEQLPAELENNLSLVAIKNMVTLSYKHLPSHLKPCFLYLGIFPRYLEIERSRLVYRWIGEGLVRARDGMTLEAVGTSYFNELLHRSMIQPSRVNIEGVIKSCRVHHIMHDIIVSLSREAGFVYTAGNKVAGSIEDNFRHVAYHAVKKDSMVEMDWGRVRSLTFFCCELQSDHAISLCLPKFRMLRALDLENGGFIMKQKDIKNIGLLQHLKYLNVHCSNIYALPRSIGKLQGLQVLEVGGSYISTLPTEICKLQSLRSLRCDSRRDYRFFKLNKPMKCLMNSLHLATRFTPSEECNEVLAELHMAYSKCWSETTGVKVQRGIGNLKELQILEVVNIGRTSRKAIKELGKLSKLRKLRLIIDREKEKKYMTLCQAIEKLLSLCSLRIDAPIGTLEWLDSVSSGSLPMLRSLKLLGRIGDKIDWFRNLKRLVKLRLDSSELELVKAMEIFADLPNLTTLGLFQTTASADERLVFKEGKFKNLRKLCISCMTGLSEIQFLQGALPQMESIAIGSCMLKEGINGINYLPKLMLISFSSLSQVARLVFLQVEVKAHPNRPVLHMFCDLSHHDLGDPDEYFDAVESVPDRDEEGREATTTLALAATASPDIVEARGEIVESEEPPV